MRNNAIAIDMGSVNTVIYQLGSGVVLSEPSVVALSVNGKSSIRAVGSEAKKLIGKTAETTKIVFPIVEGEIADVKNATAMTENFLNKITLRKLSLRPKALVSVPCGIENDEIKKYAKVLSGAGVYNADFVESPILTALGLGIPVSESTPCFIIDVGGGTTNIAAVSLDGVIAGVNVNMGGRNVDAMIINRIADLFGLRIGMLTAEKIKTQIASLIEGDATRTVINGRDIESGKPRSVSVSASDVLLPVAAFFDKIFEIASMVMAKLPAEVSAEIRRSGVYFSGGVSRLPGLDGYFRENMAIRANVFEDPEMTAAIGGGILLGNEKLKKNEQDKLRPRNAKDNRRLFGGRKTFAFASQLLRAVFDGGHRKTYRKFYRNRLLFQPQHYRKRRI